MVENEKNRLIQKYLNGTITNQEREELLTWYRSGSDVEITWSSENPDEEELVKNRILENLYGRISPKEKTRNRTSWKVMAAAAAVALFIGFGIYFLQPEQKQQADITAHFKNDIAPGGNKAILTLADGSKVSLTDINAGELAKQAGVRVVKTADNQLIYTISNSEPSKLDAQPVYNTIETPKGGQYQVNLPDGTRVWLNAASSLKYPVSFSGNKRIVEMTGEAYFEVAKMNPHSGGKAKAVPFIVKTSRQEVLVLGTHFNINAYDDEDAVKTTLLEGSVRVTSLSSLHAKAENKILKPGEQSVLRAGNIDVNKADLNAVMGWKNNNFIFNDEDLQSIMRKVSRWYDVDIQYENEPDNISYIGVVSRSKNVSAVLNALESTGKVQFKIEGKRITVF